MDPEASEHYVNSGAYCVACGYEWVAVAPVGTVGLECPNPDCGFFDETFDWDEWWDSLPPELQEGERC
jgi:hypothetical protein